MSKRYEKFYEKIIDYESKLHKRNQHKIRIGLKINIFLPLVFLLLCFLVPGSKFLFLMLWIISLFGIAFYLIYIEYTDYKMINKMHEFGIVDEEQQRSLMSENEQAIEQMEKAVDDRIDAIEARIDTEKERLEKELKRLNQERDAAEKERKDRIQELRDKRGGKK